MYIECFSGSATAFLKFFEICYNASVLYCNNSIDKNIVGRCCVYKNENTRLQSNQLEPVPRFAHQLVYDHCHKVIILTALKQSCCDHCPTVPLSQGNLGVISVSG